MQLHGQSQKADVLTAVDSRGRFRTCLTRLVGDETLLGAQKTASRPQALDLQFLFLVERALSRRCPSHGCRAAPGSCTPASMAVLNWHIRVSSDEALFSPDYSPFDFVGVLLVDDDVELQEPENSRSSSERIVVRSSGSRHWERASLRRSTAS
jgi:hypothetical protein